MRMTKKRFILSGTLFFFCLALSQDHAGEDLRSLFEQGQSAFSKGKYAEAISYYEEAVKLNPNFAPAYNALGVAHSRQDTKLSDVIWLYKVAIDIDPKYAEPYHNLCRLYHQNNQYNLAEKNCLKALEIDPSLSAAKLSLGWVYLVGISEPKKAVPYFEEVTDVIQNNGTVYYGLGMSYALSGDYTRLMNVITKLRAIGQVVYAIQLESMVKMTVQAQPNEDYAVQTKTADSALIKAAPVKAPAPPVQIQQSAKPIGSMQIRLRGNLSSTQDKQSGQNQNPDMTDGSMVPEEKSAIERIRELQRFRGPQVNVR